MPDKTEYLLGLLAEDGVKLTGRGKNRMGLCPFHEEKTPSFSVDAVRGLYFCHGCGVKGDAVTYLEGKRGLTKKQAVNLVKRAGGEEGNTAFPSRKKAKDEPPKWVPALPRDAAKHPYLDADGKEVFTICRREGKGAKVVPYTPGPRPATEKMPGGEPGWFIELRVEGLRPLYRLPELLATAPGRQVWIAEGEKCVDAVVRAFGGRVPATTWSGGTKSAHLTDFTPLRGRRILLLADADAEGRRAMRNLGEALLPLCPEVKAWMPEGEDGRDIHDYIADLGPAGALERLKAGAAALEAAPAGESPAEGAAGLNLGLPEEAEGPVSPVLNGPHFRVLGTLAPGRVVVQVASNEILVFGRIALTQPSTLIAIADMDWWLGLAQAKTLTRDACHTFGNALLREAERLGRLDMARIVGRGAHREGEQIVWHLGDRLLDVDRGEEIPLRNTEDAIYTEGARVRLLPASDCGDANLRFALAEAVMRYRWATPDDGRRFLGWLVCSVVGGALPWRPHCWLIAPASTGKSWILENVVMRALGALCARLADTTPAGIARRIASDSLPVLLEEAEPDRHWIEELIAITRLAAGGDGERVRASGETGVSIMNPRFSAMVASTKLVRLRAADASRFAVIRLSHDPVADWFGVRDSIQAALKGERPRALRSMMIRATTEIVRDAEAAAGEFQKQGEATREALVRGALTAGWNWISGSDDEVKRAATRPGERLLDAVDALREILSLPLRNSAGQEQPIADMLFRPLPDPGDLNAVRSLGVTYDAVEGLSIALKHPALELKLERSRLGKVDLAQLLAQIPSAEIPDGRARFGALRSRRVVIPPEECEAAGFEVRQVDELPDGEFI